jgi:hypothetical protein
VNGPHLYIYIAYMRKALVQLWDITIGWINLMVLSLSTFVRWFKCPIK